MKKISKTSIRNHLTIRYDPTSKFLIPQATPRDFKAISSDPMGLKTENLLKNSISSISLDEKPIAVALSSGIDSTLCLSLLREIFPKKEIICLCGVFAEGFDESIQAQKIAKKFDATFKIVHMQSAFETMPELISISKQPKWNTYNHLIAKEAKKYSNFLFTGDGADELFGGYVFRYSKFLNLHRPKDPWKIKTVNYLECHNRDWVPDQEHLFGNSIKFNWNDIYNYFKPYFSNRLSPLQQVMLADFNGKLLYDFFPSQSTFCKYYGLKGIPVFLDPILIKYALSLPLEQKYDPKTQAGKIILRKIARRRKIEHIEEKRGFSPSLWLDWKNHGKKICEKYLLTKESNILKKNIINYNWIVRAIERIDNDGDQRSLSRMISILAVEIWIRIMITKEINGTKKLKF